MRRFLNDRAVPRARTVSRDEPRSISTESDYVPTDVAPRRAAAPRLGLSTFLYRSGRPPKPASSTVGVQRENAPDTKGKRMTSESKRTTPKVILGLGILAMGTVAGALTTQALTSGAATVGPEPTSAHHQVGADGISTCSIYDAPTLESTIIPRLTLTAGLPYVIVCQDPAGREVVNEPFLLRRGD
jgi:hypothetical protein